MKTPFKRTLPAAGSAVFGGMVLALIAGPAQGGFWDPPVVAPPPIHVYDYTRGPVWTSNGWAYVPVEVHFPRPAPPLVAGPPPFGSVRHRRPPPDLGPQPIK